MSKPLILVVNDDGITSPGIKALVEAVKDLGEVVVVAPDSPQSAMGHAITINKPLRLTPVTIFEGIKAYKCSGTPVDCVKLAVDKVLHRKPDLCVSGINHGSNSSINIIYSGTMSAAMEASLEGTASVGFSLCDYRDDADFSAAIHYAKLIVEQILKYGIPSFSSAVGVRSPVQRVNGRPDPILFALRAKCLIYVKIPWPATYEWQADNGAG